MKRRQFIKNLAICAGAGAVGLPAMGKEATFLSNPSLPFVEETWLGFGQIINHSEEIVFIAQTSPKGEPLWMGYLGPHTSCKPYPFGGMPANATTKCYVNRNGKRVEVPIHRTVTFSEDGKSWISHA